MKKISLKNIKDALTRDEMRTVMAGSGISHCGTRDCLVYSGGEVTTGRCVGYQSGNYVTCYCNAINGTNPIISNGGLSRCWN